VTLLIVSPSLETPGVIDGDRNLLLGPKVALGGLDRGVPAQEFDLLKIAAGLPAKLGASPAQVMGSEVPDPNLLCTPLDDRPDRPVAERQLAQLSRLRDRPEQRASGDAGCMSPMEEKTRNGILCTLSGHGWIVRTGSKGTELIWTQRRGRFPVVVSGQIDVLPAEGRQVGKVSGLRMVSLLAQVIDRTLQVNGVP